MFKPLLYGLIYPFFYVYSWWMIKITHKKLIIYRGYCGNVVRTKWR